MKQNISQKQIKHLARLSGLKVNDQEIDTLKKDLNSILEYFSTLNELNTDKLQPLTTIKRNINVWREDTSKKTENTQAILENAPQKKHNYFKVPKIK